MARALGKPVSTCQRWMQGGFIPARHHEFVLRRANEVGIALQPADFFANSIEELAPARNGATPNNADDGHAAGNNPTQPDAKP